MVDIEAMRKLHAEATPGTWRHNAHHYAAVVSDESRGSTTELDAKGTEAYGGYLVGESIRPANADFIAAVHNNMLPMLDEIERLRAVVYRLPKTADGVYLLPGDDVYNAEHPEWGAAIVYYDDCDEDYFADWDFPNLEEGGFVVHRSTVESCYSTRAAAEAARKEACHA